MQPERYAAQLPRSFPLEERPSLMCGRCVAVPAVYFKLKEIQPHCDSAFLRLSVLRGLFACNSDAPSSPLSMCGSAGSSDDSPDALQGGGRGQRMDVAPTPKCGAESIVVLSAIFPSPTATGEIDTVVLGILSIPGGETATFHHVKVPGFHHASNLTRAICAWQLPSPSRRGLATGLQQVEAWRRSAHTARSAEEALASGGWLAG